MLGPIVDDVAALIKRDEVSIGVVGRVVVAVRGSQHHARPPHPSEYVVSADLQTDRAPAPIAPPPGLRVPPAAVTEVDDRLPMRSPAALAAALRAAETNDARQLAPVDRVEVAVLAPDRHHEAQRSEESVALTRRPILHMGVHMSRACARQRYAASIVFELPFVNPVRLTMA